MAVKGLTGALILSSAFPYSNRVEMLSNQGVNLGEHEEVLKSWISGVKSFLELIGLIASFVFLGKVFLTSTEAMNALRSTGVPFPFDTLIVITAFLFPLFVGTKLYRQGSKLKEEVKEVVRT